MENKAPLIGSIVARAILLICFAVAFLALLWSSKNIYYYELFGFSLVSITSLTVALLPLKIVKSFGFGIYLTFCIVGVLSVATMAVHHSYVYSLPTTDYV